MSKNYTHISPLNYKKSKGQVITDPSQTVPDQTMSMREILTRYARGEEILAGKESLFDEDEISNGLDLRTLDLVDLQKLKEENEAELRELKQRKLDEDAEAQKKREEAANAAAERKKQIDELIAAGKLSPEGQ